MTMLRGLNPKSNNQVLGKEIREYLKNYKRLGRLSIFKHPVGTYRNPAAMYGNVRWWGLMASNPLSTVNYRFGG